LFCLHPFPLKNVEATKNEAKFISKIPCVPDGPEERKKMSNIGSELTDKKMVNQIFNSVPTSLSRDTRYLHYNLACRTAAHVRAKSMPSTMDSNFVGKLKVQLRRSLLYHRP
jgi:hypothetical protein